MSVPGEATIRMVPGAVDAEGTYPLAMNVEGIRRAASPIDELHTEHLIMNLGPQHPSTHGVLRVLLELDGEVIVSAEPVIGYLHRGIEKLSEHRRYNAVGTLMDRADYLSGVHVELAFAMAAEQLLDVEIPRKAQWIRSLVSELTRISSHCVWYGPFGLDAGAMAPFLYMMRDRETILDIMETISGARMMFNYIRPGGVVADLPPEVEPMTRAFLKDFNKYLDENIDLLVGNEIFDARVRGVGVIDKATAVAWGLTGGCLRGSGFGWDVRKERPYAAYPELDFEIPIGISGDCRDRCLVRLEEMRIAAQLIEQLLDGMPEGDVTAKVPKVLRPAAGEAYASVESPRGELGIHLISDGGDKPYRVRMRAPAFNNLQISEYLLPGMLIADAIVTMGSLDLVLGEIDR